MTTLNNSVLPSLPSLPSLPLTFYFEDTLNGCYSNLPPHLLSLGFIHVPTPSPSSATHLNFSYNPSPHTSPNYYLNHLPTLPSLLSNKETLSLAIPLARHIPPTYTLSSKPSTLTLVEHFYTNIAASLLQYAIYSKNLQHQPAVLGAITDATSACHVILAHYATGPTLPAIDTDATTVQYGAMYTLSAATWASLHATLLSLTPPLPPLPPIPSTSPQTLLYNTLLPHLPFPPDPYSLYITKSPSASRGVTVEVTKQPGLTNAMTGRVVQKYVSEVYTVPNPTPVTPVASVEEAVKVDFRVWVLLVNDGSGGSPQVYVWDAFLVRLCGRPYDRNCMERERHLCNFSVGGGQQGGGGQPHGEGWQLIWSEQAFVKYLDQCTGEGKQWRDGKREMKKIIKESVTGMEAGVGSVRGYELLGYDFVMDDGMKPYLLEVNVSPGLTKRGIVECGRGGEWGCFDVDKSIEQMIGGVFERTVNKWHGKEKMERRRKEGDLWEEMRVDNINVAVGEGDDADTIEGVCGVSIGRRAMRKIERIVQERDATSVVVRFLVDSIWRLRKRQRKVTVLQTLWRGIVAVKDASELRMRRFGGRVIAFIRRVNLKNRQARILTLTAAAEGAAKRIVDARSVRRCFGRWGRVRRIYNALANLFGSVRRNNTQTAFDFWVRTVVVAKTRERLEKRRGVKGSLISINVERLWRSRETRRKIGSAVVVQFLRAMSVRANGVVWMKRFRNFRMRWARRTIFAAVVRHRERVREAYLELMVVKYRQEQERVRVENEWKAEKARLERERRERAEETRREEIKREWERQEEERARKEEEERERVLSYGVKSVRCMRKANEHKELLSELEGLLGEDGGGGSLSTSRSVEGLPKKRKTKKKVKKKLLGGRAAPNRGLFNDIVNVV